MTETQTHEVCLSFDFALQHSAKNKAAEFQLKIKATLPLQGVTAIYGPSGSGKTTLLRCIAGLEPKAKGHCAVAEKIWQDERYTLPTFKRDLAYVSQAPSLFTHLTVAQNLAYGESRRTPGRDQAFYDKVLSTMGIGHLLARMPAQLSGGEEQRVSIARALLTRPQVLLMDEPLSALDQPRKREILPYLEQLAAQFQIAILYVTHSLDELVRLADRVLVLEDGKLIESGSTLAIFNRLESPLQDSDEPSALLDVIAVENHNNGPLMRAEIPGGQQSLWIKAGAETKGKSLRLRVLARDVSIALSNHDDSSILNRLPAIIDAIQLNSATGTAVVTLKVGEQVLFAAITQLSLEKLQLREGISVWAQIKSVAIAR
ncbi:molybdenum ABC transporter ATP-binding protein [Spongiibacter sp. KMU-158]|uniref:Molybdenum ABC transporter ATP-binding protein n=1 Tax=Spongiibacter pelagi TaxID=2760804 RepID=A0A927C3U8_9GAMM|nr:molybdenum ABC transporter ATP-binding protein [Spongiibacter pelagi]MBD2859266.1 molybdenum ABC transporter ATP-binding protein [Spongiibacter pelagi]